MKTAHLIDRLNQVYSGDPWYGACIADVLNQQFIDPDFTIKNGNTIGQITEHMLVWRQFAIEKLNGNEEFDISPILDWKKDKTYSTKDIVQLAEDFKTTHEQLIELMSNHPDDSWLKKVVPGRGYNFEYMIEGIMDHDIYHLGQVSLLKSASER